MKKPRTAELLLDHLAEILAWRRVEATKLGFLAAGARDRDEELTLCRAGVTLLYAHWEGFVKEAAEAYLSFVTYRGVDNEQLIPSLVAVSIRSKLLNAGMSKKSADHVAFIQYFRTAEASPARLEDSTAIHTDSNLSSSVFREILATLGFEHSSLYETRSNFIDQRLVGTRNEICHGSRRPVDLKEFDELRAGVDLLIERFGEQVLDAAIEGRYLVDEV